MEAPSGAAINAASGLVNGRPQSAGDYRFLIRVDDGHGGAADQAYNVRVTHEERLLNVRGTDFNDQIEVVQDAGGIVRVINGDTRFYSGITGIGSMPSAATTWCASRGSRPRPWWKAAAATTSSMAPRW